MLGRNGRRAGWRGRGTAAAAGWCAAAAAALLLGTAAPGAAAAAAAGTAVFGERRTAAPPSPGSLRALSREDHAAMGEARARELLSAVTVTRDGALGERRAGDAEVRLFLEEGRAPARGGAAPENVIGTDERVRVTNTRQAPFRSVGKVQIGCSGTLIGPRHVLTSAHCVYDFRGGFWYRDLDFTPGRNGGAAPFGVLPWERALAPAGYVRSGIARFDYAVIELARPATAGVGTLPFAARSGSGDGLRIDIVGYPGDKPFGTMWRSSCGTDGIGGGGLLNYQCDTQGGMSGSPVLVGGLGGRPTVVAVHGYGNTDGRGRPVFNSAVPITASVRQQIQAWIRAD